MILFYITSTTASSLSAMLEQARRSTHDMTRHVKTCMTHACRVITCRDMTQQVEFGL